VIKQKNEMRFLLNIFARPKKFKTHTKSYCPLLKKGEIFFLYFNFEFEAEL